MKYILLIIMLIVCDSCICCYYKPNKDKVEFNISAIQRSNSYYSFNLLIKNNDSNTISFLTFKNDTILVNCTDSRHWHLEIMLNGDIPMYAGEYGLIRSLFVPGYSDYLKLKPNEQKVLYFEIDFKELKRGSSKYGGVVNSAAPYGSYTVQLFYEDFYSDYTCAIDSIVSNKIVVNYKE